MRLGTSPSSEYVSPVVTVSVMMLLLRVRSRHSACAPRCETCQRAEGVGRRVEERLHAPSLSNQSLVGLNRPRSHAQPAGVDWSAIAGAQDVELSHGGEKRSAGLVG